MTNATETSIMISDGTFHDVLDVVPQSFTLENIAISLGNVCRWGGHLGHSVNQPRESPERRITQRPEPLRRLKSNFYSVAEHSVLGARYHMNRKEDDKARLFLLHDAGEPFLGGDIPTPLKRELPLVSEWEDEIHRVLKDAFSLRGSFSDIKETDIRICRNETIGLYGDQADWAKSIPPLYYENDWDKTLIRVEKWSPEQAMNEWYDLAVKLKLENKYAA